MSLRGRLLLGAREYVRMDTQPWRRPQKLKVSGLLPGNVYHEETLYLGPERWHETQAKYLKIDKVEVIG